MNRLHQRQCRRQQTNMNAKILLSLCSVALHFASTSHAFSLLPSYRTVARSRSVAVMSLSMQNATLSTSPSPSFNNKRHSFSVGDFVGSGSYGTVRLLITSNSRKPFVGKRAWTRDEIMLQMSESEDAAGSISSSSNTANRNNGAQTKVVQYSKPPTTAERQKDERQQEKKLQSAVREREERCQYYWNVEQHCFSKIAPHPQLPLYLGTNQTESTDGNKAKQWMIFDFVGHTNSDGNGDSDADADNKDDDDEADGVRNKPAPSLAQLMKLDHEDKGDHTLHHLATALFGRRPSPLESTFMFTKTLDTILQQMLSVLAHVHSHQVVHRDVKPGNLLVFNQTIYLIDFGSAADLESSKKSGKANFLSPFGSSGKVGLENRDRVAVSPLYCAPEIFLDPKDHPTNFDIFSAGMIFCQLIFGYLEEKMDAGFHQQLEEVDWDLNMWLSNELGSVNVRPTGLTESLEGYLSERSGLWTLLSEMVHKEPSSRPSAKKALRRLELILQGEGPKDGPFFQRVLQAYETCDLPVVSRPLHFVATFSRSESLGLVLAEADADEDDFSGSQEQRNLWVESTKDADRGEVFVKEILPGGQADLMGSFQVGDRLQGVGELPFSVGGFEQVVDMLQDLPLRAKNVKLQFDRLSVRRNDAIPMNPRQDIDIDVVDRGGWSTKGKRANQEDAFVLHETHDTQDRSVLVAGVMDGHGGSAAANLVAETLPSTLSNQLLVYQELPVSEALDKSWTFVCDGYRSQCSVLEDTCLTPYDPREGKLFANTGSDTMVAGTTTSVFALDEQKCEVSFLNCGDSRSMLVSSAGQVVFATQDHTPEDDFDRLKAGIEEGLDFALPQCNLSRWWMEIGDYEYGVSRSLEGSFATSKGIVSDADVTTVPVEPGMILISATDGIWNVMDSEEVARDLKEARETKKLSAREAAHYLCTLALRKGSTDNMSAVVIYL